RLQPYSLSLYNHTRFVYFYGFLYKVLQHLVNKLNLSLQNFSLLLSSVLLTSPGSLYAYVKLHLLILTLYTFALSFLHFSSHMSVSYSCMFIIFIIIAKDF